MFFRYLIWWTRRTQVIWFPVDKKNKKKAVVSSFLSLCYHSHPGTKMIKSVKKEHRQDLIRRVEAPNQLDLQQEQDSGWNRSQEEEEEVGETRGSMGCRFCHQWREEVEKKAVCEKRFSEQQTIVHVVRKTGKNLHEWVSFSRFLGLMLLPSPDTQVSSLNIHCVITYSFLPIEHDAVIRLPKEVFASKAEKVKRIPLKEDSSENEEERRKFNEISGKDSIRFLMNVSTECLWKRFFLHQQLYAWKVRNLLLTLIWSHQGLWIPMQVLYFVTDVCYTSLRWLRHEKIINVILNTNTRENGMNRQGWKRNFLPGLGW